MKEKEVGCQAEAKSKEKGKTRKESRILPQKIIKAKHKDSGVLMK